MFANQAIEGLKGHYREMAFYHSILPHKGFLNILFFSKLAEIGEVFVHLMYEYILGKYGTYFFCVVHM
jgi:hypothetical protein